MRKIVKTVTVGLLTVGMGVVALPAANVPALAKTKAAKIISTKAIKKTAYNANAGYLYSSTKLTKKSHHAINYLKTTFYATKSAKVQRKNGKKAVYYYVKNKKGNVKGWIWRGNLTKINNKAMNLRKSDITNTVAAVRMMATENQDESLEYLANVGTNNVYDNYYGLPRVIRTIYGHKLANAKATLQANTNFKGRFDSITNTQLSALSARLSEAIETNDDTNDPSVNLANALANAVSTLY